MWPVSRLPTLLYRLSPLLLPGEVELGCHPERGSGHGEGSGEVHCLLFVLLSAGFEQDGCASLSWAMFPSEQGSFSHVCGPDASLLNSAHVLRAVCLAFGVDTVNDSWPESMKLIG